MAVAYPKRSEKKNKNREQLIDAADRLFATKGYQHTTLNDVAEKAGLHVQTLYKQFKNKDELAMAAAGNAIDHLREHFDAATDDDSTIDTWRAFITDVLAGLLPMGIGEYKRRQLQSASSMMNDNFLLIVYAGYEDVLTEHLAADFGLDPETHHLPRLVASLLWNGAEVAIKRCAGIDTGKDVLHDGKAILEENLAVIDDIEEIFSTYVK
ncbi:TetR/AcrR family transcriptional regulator [Gammaproteobacteria bacterium]|nr:TetR/AcrR family transcriptional regulator [Gammaproteobacteria bacterium]